MSEGPNSKFTIEVRHQFDRELWQVASVPDPGSSLLISWAVEPPPVDAGMPPVVQESFAAALCALGPVIYAGDADTDRSIEIGTVGVRRGLSYRRIILFRARVAGELLPAFNSGTHDWSMNAQWLLVIDPAVFQFEQLETLIRSLYQDWQLPDAWPSGVLIIVQAGVDGDAAACHCRHSQIGEQLSTTLGHLIKAAGGDFHMIT